MIMILAVLTGIVLAGGRLIGLRPYVVLSGSMEPAYHVGSLICVKSMDCKELEIGDPVTYTIGKDMVVTHRIIDILAAEEDSDQLQFITKGDANEIPDGAAVSSKHVIGSPIFTIPYLGYVLHYIQNPPWIYIAICVCVIVGLFLFFPVEENDS